MISFRNGCAVVTALAAIAILPGFVHSARAQQQRPELPESVTDWLARDQVQRWAGLLETGKQLFADGSCTMCHGDEGSNGRWGPDLTDADWVQSDGGLAGVRETVMWGVRRRDFVDPNRRFQMNPAGGMNLEEEELDALAAYVWSLSNGTFLPTRENQ